MASSGFVRHFIACNKHDLSGFAPFLIGATRYGRMKKEFAEFLLRETALFEWRNDGLELSRGLTDFAARSAALDEATRILAAQINKPLRNELYPVVEKWGDTPVAQLDRLSVPFFGVRAWGIHVNGFVRKKDGLHLWIGERAANRQVSPGMLDNMIGGGLPIGLTLEENLCKEAKEEAGMDAALARKAKLVRSLDYFLELPYGLRTDTLFLYDLEVPESFVPENTDGEVAAFHLMPLAEVAEIIRTTDRFKFNCNMVITDFMVRHGFITPDEDEFGTLNVWLKKKLWP